MRLTRESKFALLGLAYLARRPSGKLTPLAEVATAQDLPVSFLSKIFQKLGRAGLLISERGRKSGYALARPGAEIRIRDVLEAVEGRDIFQRCLLWNGSCGDTNPCPLHFRLKELRPSLESIFSEVTLDQYLSQSRRESLRRAASSAGRKSTRRK